MSSTARRLSARRWHFASSIRSPAFPRIAPFAVFIALLALQPLLEGRFDPRIAVVAHALAAGAVLAIFWRRYTELRSAPGALRPAEVVVAIAIGLAVFGVWIGFDSGWAVLGGGKPFV